MAEFPLRLEGREVRTFNTVDELVDSVFDEYQSRLKLNKKDVKITDVLWFFGITDNKGNGNTMCLADVRTIDILGKYDFLQASPCIDEMIKNLVNTNIWFEAVKILSKIKPRLF